MTAELPVADIYFTAFEFARVAGLPAVDVGNAVRVCGRDKGKRVIGVVFGHGDGRHHQNPVRVDGSGLVGLGAAHDNAVFSFFHNMGVQIRIGLTAGRQTAVAFRIGHGAVDNKIFFLHHFKKPDKSIMVLRAEFLIHFERDAVHGIDGIHADTALETGAGFLSQQPLHFYFFDQVFRALMQMAETVYLFSGQMRFRRHQIFMLGALSQGVRHFYGIHGRPDDWMIGGAFHLFTQKVDFQIHFTQAFFVLISGFQSHFRPPRA